MTPDSHLLLLLSVYFMASSSSLLPPHPTPGFKFLCDLELEQSNPQLLLHSAAHNNAVMPRLVTKASVVQEVLSGQNPDTQKH